MKYGLGYILFLALFLSDRLTKWIAVACLNGYYYLNSYISFGLQFNRGISWGMLHSDNTLLFCGITILSLIVMLMVVAHGVQEWRMDRPVYAHAMIVSGAASNILDRVMYGGVIDFIHLHAFGWAFPAFNIADCAIVCGVILLFLQDVRYES